MQQLGSNWMDFHEIWYLSIIRIYVEKIQVSLKSDKNNGHFAWRYMYISDFFSLLDNLIIEASRSHSDTPHSVGHSYVWVISPSQKPVPGNTQHSKGTGIHVNDGIRTRNPNKRAAVDPRLRLRGHGDRSFMITSRWILHRFRNIIDKFVKKIETRFMFSTFISKDRAFYEIMWNNMIQPDRPQI
jgi:hypothetical protein